MSATAEVCAEPEVNDMKMIFRLACVSVAAMTWTAACSPNEPSPDDDAANEGGSDTTPPPPPTMPPTDPPPTDPPPPTQGGICNSGLTSGSDGEDACLSASCCDAFNACVADTTCNGCLTNAQAPGCDTDPLLDAFNTCADSNCKTNVCDEGITFNDGNGDPAFACISCASETTACCTALNTCVGDGSQAAVTDCLTCLNDPSINQFDPVVPTAGECFDLGNGIPEAAQQFQQCLQDNCATDCGIAP